MAGFRWLRLSAQRCTLKETLNLDAECMIDDHDSSAAARLVFRLTEFIAPNSRLGTAAFYQRLGALCHEKAEANRDRAELQAARSAV
jgi:hypothetical protein